MKMVKQILFLCLLFIISATPACFSCDENLEIERTIKSLSLLNNISGAKMAMDQFLKQPETAACLLIEELSVVREKNILISEKKESAETMHVVWCIRSLRYITNGVFFTEKSQNKFDESESDRESFLTKHVGEEGFVFFKERMSTGTIFIAPKDTQEKIIQKWKQWFRVNGATYNYSPSSRLDEWYF